MSGVLGYEFVEKYLLSVHGDELSDRTRRMAIDTQAG